MDLGIETLLGAFLRVNNDNGSRLQTQRDSPSRLRLLEELSTPMLLSLICSIILIH
jgi:hypothetical protein